MKKICFSLNNKKSTFYLYSINMSNRFTVIIIIAGV